MTIAAMMIAAKNRVPDHQDPAHRPKLMIEYLTVKQVARKLSLTENYIYLSASQKG